MKSSILIIFVIVGMALSSNESSQTIETTENSTHKTDDRCAVNKISVDRCQLLSDLNDNCKSILETESLNHFNVAACYTGCLYYINGATKDGLILLEGTATLLSNQLAHLPIDSNTTNLIIVDCMTIVYKWRESLNVWAKMAGGRCSYFMIILNYCIIDKLEKYGVTNEVLQDCVDDFKCFKKFIGSFRATS